MIIHALLSRGDLREVPPFHWVPDGQDSFTCDRCNESFGQDTESFPNPNPRFVTLRVCEACHKGE